MEYHQKEPKQAIFAIDFPELFHIQIKVFNENLIKIQRNIQ